jgi:hypothetical protein
MCMDSDPHIPLQLGLRRYLGFAWHRVGYESIVPDPETIIVEAKIVGREKVMVRISRFGPNFLS